MTLKTAHTEQLVKPKEAAELLGVHPNTIRNWIKQGKIPYVETPTGQYLLPWTLLTQTLRGTYSLGEPLKQDAPTEDDTAQRLGE